MAGSSPSTPGTAGATPATPTVRSRIGRFLGWLLLAFLGFVILNNFIHNQRDRKQMNESSTVSNVRTINTASITYGDTYPKLGFPASLKHLGPPAEGQQYSEEAAALIDEKLASGTKSGYHIRYVAKPANQDGLRDAYTVHASPVNPGETGVLHFFSDQTGVIRYRREGPADEKSQPIQ